MSDLIRGFARLIGFLLPSILLYIISMQFKKRFFIELFLFLSFIALFWGTLGRFTLPSEIVILELITTFIVYPIYRIVYLKIKKKLIKNSSQTVNP